MCQREQESLLAVVCKSLKEEHQAELRRLREQTEQVRHEATFADTERGSDADKLTVCGLWPQESQAVALRLEEEAVRLRAQLGEKEVDYDQLTAETGQQLRRWAEELTAECRHLLLLVEQSGPPQSSVKLQPR